MNTNWGKWHTKTKFDNVVIPDIIPSWRNTFGFVIIFVRLMKMATKNFQSKLIPKIPCDQKPIVCCLGSLWEKK